MSKPLFPEGPYAIEEREGHTRFGSRLVITAPGIDRLAVISENGGVRDPRPVAALFAAAPDLYDALSRIVETGFSAQAEGQARAALAKAGGQS